VCVTGLIVVDTGSHFTSFGQVIIMILIQVGGIGIMTFASYFSYFFRGGSSYKNQLLLRDMSNTEKLTEVFNTLKKIILLTLLIELIGGIFIYSSLDKTVIPAFSERLFFSIFHAISGFCNAGFSTLPNSLYEVGFRFNYPLHLAISLLFILGGIGFPILFNFLKYLKYLFINRLLPFSMNKAQHRVPWIINLNSRMVVITSLVLIVGGTLLFFISEYNNTLQEHKGLGKLVTAFFGAVTTRTAGFNTVDTGALNISTIMVVIFLMWVGASPASTGGGIKTSTLAVGFLNIVNLAKGNSRIEIYCRQVAAISIQRAYAIMMLSVIVIGTSVLLVSLIDPHLPIRSIVFECFSAYSTVGLSMGITADLSSLSKVVIVITMFIGRVSMLSILIAIFRNVTDLKYTYPTEEILIN
jgi:trk system potassium uptake protein